MFRHTCYNLIGLGAPLIVAIITIPLLIEALGVERFGILTLVWALVSYFGLFDLGLGRALTRELAAMPDRRSDEAKRLVATALTSTGLLGVAAGGLLALGADGSVRQFGGVTDPAEALGAVYAMAVAIPVIVMTSALRGVLEAERAFGVINAIRLPMGVYTFLAPLAVIDWWGNDLTLIAVALTAGRIVAYAAHAWFCRKVSTGVPGVTRVDRRLLKGLLHTGGWMTVSNVIGPLMAYLDRYVIGLTLSVSAVAYYATPYEIITRLWIIPGALTAVLFPRFAELAERDLPQGRALFRHGILLLFVVIYPVALGIALFARELLELWLDAEFAAHSFPLLQVFACGILINCLAHVPFTFLQATGRADITARIHLAEFPLFVLLLWLAAEQFGLFGAVFVWLARMVADTLLMFRFSLRNMETALHRILDWKLALILLSTLLSFMAIYIPGVSARALLWLAFVLLSYTLCWQLLLNASDRSALMKRFLHAGA